MITFLLPVLTRLIVCDVIMSESGANVDQDGGTVANTTSPPKLSRAQRAQIERNRQRALMLRQSRQQRAQLRERVNQNASERVLSVAGSQVIDTGGGFFIDAEQNAGDPTGRAPEADSASLLQPPAPLAPDCRPPCEECSTDVAGSFLLDNFSRAVCDSCRRQHAEKYSLIARTEAKREYILRDEDLDERPPPLPYISRKNPHRKHSTASSMRLYLRLQVEQRALVVWGTEGALEEALEQREQKRDTIKRNKLRRNIKALRMEMRSSVYRRDVTRHEHTFGEEEYNAAEDTYSRVCTECKHVQTYEKM